MKTISRILSVCALVGIVTFTSCGDEDNGPGAVALDALTADGTSLSDGTSVSADLNGATSATDVPVNAAINATFSREIDEATVTAAAITLSTAEGAVDYTLAVSGSTITLTPSSDLVRGTIHILAISADITGADGGLVSAASRTFTTEGRAPAVVPEEDKLVVYLPFNGEVVEANGKTIISDAVSFGDDRFGAQMSAADFNGTTNYVGVEYSADMSNASTTVSYWMKLPSSDDHQAHIGTTDTGISQFATFSIGANNGTFHEFNRFTCCDLGYDIDVLNYFTNHLNSGSASTLAGSAIEMKNEGNPSGDKVIEVDNPTWVEGLTGNWAHIVTTWDASARRKAFFINGVPSTVFELTPSAEYALDGATIDVAAIDADPSNDKNLYLGTGVPFWATLESDGSVTPFRGGKAFAFKGQMDDFRMFSVALTDAQVLELYNAERP
ncbi:MAG: Ig-like domain-containing protein [Cyclobacteriaceae bacterium]